MFSSYIYSKSVSRPPSSKNAFSQVICEQDQKDLKNLPLLLSFIWFNWFYLRLHKTGFIWFYLVATNRIECVLFLGKDLITFIGKV